MIRKIFKSEAGFSLVQGMVIAGVLAGSGLVATRLMTDQKLSQRGAETRDSIDQLHGLVYSVLQNKDHCFETFSGMGNSLVTGTWDDRRTLAVPEISSGGAPAVRVNDGTVATRYMNGQVSVTNMNVVYPIPDALGTSPRPGFGRLQVTYRRLNDNDRQGKGYGAKDVRKDILLRIQKSSTGFTSCYAVVDGADGNQDLNRQLCMELNADGDANAGTSLFQWNEENSTCEPRHNVCPPNQVSSGIGSDGLVRCRNLTDWVDLNKIIVNSGTCEGSQKQFEIFDTNGTKRVRIRCSPSPLSGSCNCNQFSCPVGTCCASGPATGAQIAFGAPVSEGACLSHNFCSHGATSTTRRICTWTQGGGGPAL